jgi:hypothetical protein
LRDGIEPMGLFDEIRIQRRVGPHVPLEVVRADHLPAGEINFGDQYVTRFTLLPHGRFFGRFLFAVTIRQIGDNAPGGRRNTK